jgi:hypothetical protein
LQQEQEQMWPVWISSIVACMWAIVSVPFVWQGYEWLGHHADLPTFLWQTLAVATWLMPAGALTTLALYLRGNKVLHTEMNGWETAE